MADEEFCIICCEKLTKDNSIPKCERCRKSGIHQTCDNPKFIKMCPFCRTRRMFNYKFITGCALYDNVIKW
jgi:hypothetical protein